MKEIFIAAVPSIFTLIGVIITVAVGNKNTNNIIKEQTSLTLYRLEQVERKQDRHNNLIERVYKNEQDIEVLKERISSTNNRIDDIEKNTG